MCRVRLPERAERDARKGGAGLLVVPAGDVTAMAYAMMVLLQERELTRDLGETAQKRSDDYALLLIARQYERALFGEDTTWKSPR
jgi:glycosyltransferase involved in cell wall biosynthesis